MWFQKFFSVDGLFSVIFSLIFSQCLLTECARMSLKYLKSGHFDKRCQFYKFLSHRHAIIINTSRSMQTQLSVPKSIILFNSMYFTKDYVPLSHLTHGRNPTLHWVVSSTCHSYNFENLHYYQYKYTCSAN